MRSNSPMTLEEVRAYAPAVFATERDEHRTSDRYSFVPSHSVVTAMMDAGWGISRAQQKHTRRGEDMSTTRHLLAFRPLSTFNKMTVADGIPEVLMVNAHNATAAWVMMAGIFRLICTNGLMVGKTIDQARIMHRGSAAEQAVEAAERIIQNTGDLNGMVQAMMSTKLKALEKAAFAEQAMAIRFGDNKPFASGMLLEARRPEDNGDDLWRVYNRVQENLMQGGMEGRSATGRRSLTRPIGRITRDVEYNQKLWDLTTDFLEAA